MSDLVHIETIQTKDIMNSPIKYKRSSDLSVLETIKLIQAIVDEKASHSNNKHNHNRSSHSNAAHNNQEHQQQRMGNASAEHFANGETHVFENRVGTTATGSNRIWNPALNDVHADDPL